MNSLLQLLKNRRPRNALNVITVFLAVVSVSGYCMTQIPGIAHDLFAILTYIYLLLLMGGFFYVLIRYPRNFYAPSEQGNGNFFGETSRRKGKRTSNIRDNREKKKEPLCPNLEESLGENTKTFEAIANKISKPSAEAKDTRKLDTTTLEDIAETPQNGNLETEDAPINLKKNVDLESYVSETIQTGH
jgi:hypothetical protein